MEKKNIAVLMTVFNRKETTLKGLRSLYKAIEELGDGYAFDVYMTDDGCTDGTGETVAEEFSEIKIIKGSGSLYWGGGMRKAWQAAIDSGIVYDYYLWFNDDTLLFNTALKVLFGDYKSVGTMSIISGGCCDSKEENTATYGGRIEQVLVIPSGEPQKIILMNGNIVLIPNCVAKEVGIINDYYRHSLGDFDYGLRAQKEGIDVFLSSVYVGTCDRHDNDLKYCNPRIGVVQRIKWLYSPRYDVIRHFSFNMRYLSLFTAVGVFVKQNIRAILAIKS